MSRIAYVNGRYLPHRAASVHIEDRGHQFADGIYEVIAVWKGRPVDLAGHFDRLETGLRELKIPMPANRPVLAHVLREVVRRNKVTDGIVYLQVNRGTAPRVHTWSQGIKPSVVATARPMPAIRKQVIEDGVKVISVEDIRWKRRDIKTVGLLPNAMAKQKAAEAGCYEVFQVDADGMVTEAGASNAWIVDQQGRLVTRPLGHEILPGITRATLIDLARANGIEVEERAFSLEEAKQAREAFVSGTTAFVMPVVQIDDAVLGNGKPGSVATRLRALYYDHLNAIPADAWTHVAS
ncbi:D-amino-acid transaminase [Caenispirillum salinarum]|uniref:D-amino-acid transaminase n=1 Tax=Caenispirillum salinarum TaxID=859058 RepID=UPI00384B5E3F